QHFINHPALLLAATEVRDRFELRRRFEVLSWAGQLIKRSLLYTGKDLAKTHLRLPKHQLLMNS
ncbi:MAG: hypothetical protein M0P70_14935, partial [Desulfobulbaceae bacterium]|nr:hypothetical protein [Desulfobulbaceae bacterium]